MVETLEKQLVIVRGSWVAGGIPGRAGGMALQVIVGGTARQGRGRAAGREHQDQGMVDGMAFQGQERVDGRAQQHQETAGDKVQGQGWRWWRA